MTALHKIAVRSRTDQVQSSLGYRANNDKDLVSCKNDLRSVGITPLTIMLFSDILQLRRDNEPRSVWILSSERCCIVNNQLSWLLFIRDLCMISIIPDRLCDLHTTTGAMYTYMQMSHTKGKGIMIVVSKFLIIYITRVRLTICKQDSIFPIIKRA